MKELTLEDLTKDELLRVLRKKLLFGMRPSDIAFVRWQSVVKKNERLWEEYQAMPGYSDGRTIQEQLAFHRLKDAKWLKLDRSMALADKIYNTLVNPKAAPETGEEVTHVQTV